MRRIFFAVLLSAMGCNSSKPDAEPPSSDPPPAGNEPVPADTPPPECQIQTDAEHGPGWPYALPRFRDEILPALVSDCGGCHAAPAGMGGYKVWLDAAPGNCSYAKTFNAFSAMVNLDDPPNSALYRAISGGAPLHPYRYPEDSPKLGALLSFLTEAAAERDRTAPPTTPPPAAANPYDYAVFQSTIQPIIDTADNKGCSAAACHGSELGVAGFKVFREPAPDSPEMFANFNAVILISSLTEPERSRFLLRAQQAHANGTSAVVDTTQAAAILAWIEDARGNAAPPGVPPPAETPTCVGAENFNLSVFDAEIAPILLGQIDLNDRGDTRATTGCARAACHGQDRTGGAFVFKASNTPAQNLQNFACFVNFTNPVASEILACPSNLPGCRRSPHPGAQIFDDANDKNYQRILSFIYAAKTAATPLDFAFFARRINPIFSDPSAIVGGTGRTCAECHGVSAVGQSAPNGSNFPMIGNAVDKDRVAFNFSASANFVNFINPIGSSLFLYPTNEIANLENPFATGLPHPGGPNFAPDSRPAVDILTWARGLRPDAGGFLKYWLVAGDYPAATITDVTAIDELTTQPKIFDPMGAADFNGGQWDGLFSEEPKVDLDAAFPRAATAGRVAYAVAYVLNTSAADIQAQLTVTSSNAVKLYAGDRPILQAEDASTGITGLAVFPRYVPSAVPTRILLKVLQRRDNPTFKFALKLRDQFGNPLTDATGELIIKLGPDGGI